MPQPKSSMRVKTLETQAYEWMRENVITGEWAQGSHLKDSEIAVQLGISATPVREALRKLATEGLVQTIPYRGTFVTSFSAIQVVELINVRLGLELMGLEFGLPGLSGDQIATMEAAIADFDRALVRNELTTLLEADVAFHRTLVHSGRNSVLNELYRQLTGRVQMLMAIADISGRMATGNKDHEEILQAVCTGDREAVALALRNHLSVTRDAILAHWPESEQAQASNGERIALNESSV
jgi:DNA-binding GntR family transcriptional regulator